jgi:uncharacterized protein YijF (DUF1287 family)
MGSRWRTLVDIVMGFFRTDSEQPPSQRSSAAPTRQEQTTYIDIINGERLPQDKAREITLASHCDLALEDLASLGYPAETIQQVKDAYVAAVPDDPVVALYAQDTPERNRAHFFLSHYNSMPLPLVLDNKLSNSFVSYSDLFPHIKEKDLSSSLDQVAKGPVQAISNVPMGYVVQYGKHIFLDPRHATTPRNFHDDYVKELLCAYCSDATDPWNEAVTVLERKLPSLVHRKHVTQLSQGTLYDALVLFRRMEKAEIRGYQKFLKEDVPQATGVSFDSVVCKIQTEVGLRKARTHAKKLPYGNVLLASLGFNTVIVRRVFADVAYSHSKMDEPIDYALVEEQTMQILRHRLANGWFHVTPIKRKVIRDNDIFGMYLLQSGATDEDLTMYKNAVHSYILRGLRT